MGPCACTPRRRCVRVVYARAATCVREGEREGGRVGRNIAPRLVGIGYRGHSVAVASFLAHYSSTFPLLRYAAPSSRSKKRAATEFRFCLLASSKYVTLEFLYSEIEYRGDHLSFVRRNDSFVNVTRAICRSLETLRNERWTVKKKSRSDLSRSSSKSKILHGRRVNIVKLDVPWGVSTRSHPIRL